MKSKNDLFFWGITYFLIFHFLGWLCLRNVEWASVFKVLIPWHILISTILLLSIQRQKNKDFLLFCLLIIVAGYLIEWIGVHTGILFGKYAYGEALGWKLGGVPLIIGFNWLLLTYCCGMIVAKLPSKTYVKIMLAAMLMVIMKFFMDPAAFRYDYWFFFDRIAPVQSYIAWFIVSCIFLSCFFYFKFKRRNSLVWILYTMQLLFYMALALDM